MNNERYGRPVPDAAYILRVIKDAQSKIDFTREECEADGDCYSSDGMKDTILYWLDDLGIYPDDIDHVFSELEF